MNKRSLSCITTVLSVLLFANAVVAQGTSFSYQGSLESGGSPASGNHDFEFALFDMLAAGTQLGSVVSVNNVAVTNGIFSVQIDFGAAFPGAGRFLEIRVRPAGQPAFTTLTPRQSIDSSPYAIKSLNADIAATATNATQLGGVAASQYVITTDPRMTDARNPLPGSTNYIWNQNSVLQPSSNFIISGNGFIGGLLEAGAFNISGNGTVGGTLSANAVNVSGNGTVGGTLSAGAVNISGNGTVGGTLSANAVNISGNGIVGGTLSGNAVSAATQFNLGGARILRASNNNLALGLNAGFGDLSVGFRNTIVGNGAGTNFGENGRENSIFGMEAGTNIGNGIANSYFGFRAGIANTGNSNAFFGTHTGAETTNASGNTFIGNASGSNTTTGSRNTFLGISSGPGNITGSDNTLIGPFTNVSSGDLVFATAIGAGAVVGLSNTILLGRIDGSDRVQIPGQLQLVSLATGGVTSLCRTPTTFIATCSSSLRYKTGVQAFTGGLNVVRRLRPITFNWREGGSTDIGFGAEEVNAVEPLLVTRNDKGEIEGVKYAQITTVLVNAANEQQKQIDEQRDLIRKQQSEISELKAFICSENPAATFCVEKKP